MKDLKMTMMKQQRSSSTNHNNDNIINKNNNNNSNDGALFTFNSLQPSLNQILLLSLLVCLIVNILYLHPIFVTTTTTTRTATTNAANPTASKQQEISPHNLLSYQESYGFFTDIPDWEWKILQQRVSDVYPNTCSYCRGRNNAPNAWFQNHYEPEFACRHERRIGRLGDGGKWVCDPYRLTQRIDTNVTMTTATTTTTTPCLVYSVGSNNDFSFEAAIQDTIGKHCEIHTFDPANYTERAIENNVNYHMWGIDGTAHKDRRGGIYKTLRETIQELNHTNRIIDIFKIDCEGCEFSSYHTWVNSTMLENVTLQQVLVEVHAGKQGVEEPQTSNFFKGMHDNGYVIFHKEPNIHYWHIRPCVEFAFIKLAPSFFLGMKNEEG